MNSTDLLSIAPKLLGSGAAVFGTVRLTGIVKSILGPAAIEIGKSLEDEARRYRYGRQLACLQKAEAMTLKAGFKPKSVPVKMLFQLLDGASLEEDENIHTMWSALLANASSPHAELVHPSYIGLLRQMTASEAAVLDRMCSRIERHYGKDPDLIMWLTDFTFDRIPSVSETKLIDQFRSLLSEDLPEAKTSTKSFRLGMQSKGCVLNLEAANLIRRKNLDGVAHFSLTARGFEFVTACRPPKGKSNAATQTPKKKRAAKPKKASKKSA